MEFSDIAKYNTRKRNMFTLQVMFDHGKVLKQMARAVITRNNIMLQQQKSVHEAVGLIQNFRTIKYNLGRQTGLTTFVADCLNSGFNCINTDDTSYTDNKYATCGFWTHKAHWRRQFQEQLKGDARDRTFSGVNETMTMSMDDIEIMFVDLHSCGGNCPNAENEWLNWLDHNIPRLPRLKLVIII